MIGDAVNLLQTFLIPKVTSTTPQPSAHIEHQEQHQRGLRHHDPYYGWDPATYALIFGILSGSSLPIAATLGIVLSPDEETEEGKRRQVEYDKACGLMMAFGAGALLFAVTVELYGHALHQVDKQELSLLEMFTIIFGALCGGAFYLTINQWLDNYLCGGETADESPRPNSSSSGALENAQETDSLKKDMESQDQGSSYGDGSAPAKKSSAKHHWGKIKAHVVKEKKTPKFLALIHEAQKRGLELKGRDKALMLLKTPTSARDDSNSKEVQKAKSVALALFIGLLVDGVPEGVLMGFLAAEGHLTPVLIVSLFVANFPEAFSSASLLAKARISTSKIIGMWLGLCILVGCLAGLACYLLLLSFPHFGERGHEDNQLPTGVLIGIALTEGVTGGAMIACISSVMLPEAFERAGKEGAFYAQSGFFCLSGFLLSASLKATFG